MNESAFLEFFIYFPQERRSILREEKYINCQHILEKISERIQANGKFRGSSITYVESVVVSYPHNSGAPV